MNRQRMAIGLASLLMLVTSALALARNAPLSTVNDAQAESRGASPALPQDRATGRIEVVSELYNAMPGAVAVSRTGRVFLSFPRTGAASDFSVAELKDGKPVPYPNAQIQKHDPAHQADKLVSVRGMAIDANDHLWLLDTGKLPREDASPGGPKLVEVDLAQDRVVRKIVFPSSAALPTSNLSDVVIDLSRGKAGIAFVTDASENGPNAIVVVDLASGRSWRKLNDHPSTKAEKDFLPIVEGRAVMKHMPGQKPGFCTTGIGAVALSADGKRLFYCPDSSRRLYSVSADALADEAMPEDKCAATVVDEGMKAACDALTSDSKDRVYAAAYEADAILRRAPGGTWETVAHDPRMLWPEALCLAADGYLYFTCTQNERSPDFHDGKDERAKPYVLFRVKLDGAAPVRLAPPPTTQKKESK